MTHSGLRRKGLRRQSSNQDPGARGSFDPLFVGSSYRPGAHRFTAGDQWNSVRGLIRSVRVKPELLEAGQRGAEMAHGYGRGFHSLSIDVTDTSISTSSAK